MEDIRGVVPPGVVIGVAARIIVDVHGVVWFPVGIFVEVDIHL